MRHTIIDIFWERIFLHIIYESTESKQLFLQNKDNDQFLDEKGKVIKEEFRIAKDIGKLVNKGEKVALESNKIGDNKYEIVVNTVAAKNRFFLENGKWKIGIFETDKKENEEDFIDCYVSEELAYKTENLDKIFRYGGKYAYTVSFELYSNDDITMHLLINSKFMKVNDNWKKRSAIEEANGLISFIKKEKLALTKKGINLFYQIATRIMPKKGNKILIMSETNKNLHGNLKAISDRLTERGLDKQFKIQYSLRDSVGNYSSILSWIKTVIKIAGNDYIIVDNFVPEFGFLNLDKRISFIQVWHAGGGFKAVGYARFGKSGSPFPAESCHKKYTHALAASSKLVKVFEEVFGIEKEAFFISGVPRMDGFLDENRINEFKNKFYEKYPELKNKKIILFAPTYRGSGQRTAFYDYSKLDFKRLYDFCGEEYVILMKMHPFIKEKPEIQEYSDRIIDFSDYLEINNLYYVTDILITDYSSCYYEYALMKRPVLFYTYDRAVYEMTRGVHQHINDSAPGKVCNNFEELISALEKKDYELEKVEKFVKENFDEYDSHSVDKLIDKILLKK